jgi:hypothetical protein
VVFPHVGGEDVVEVGIAVDGIRAATSRVILFLPKGTSGSSGPGFASGILPPGSVACAAERLAARNAANVPAPRNRSRRRVETSSTGSSSIIPFMSGFSSSSIDPF